MYYQVKGLILRSQVCGEADKSIIAFTDQWGKISLMVPGAKKIKAKLAAATDPVTETDFIVYAAHHRARPKVTGAKVIDHYLPIKRKWQSFVYAQYCAELCDALTPFNMENERTYDLISRSWKLLATVRNPERIVMAFSLRFLKLSGYSFVEYLNNHETYLEPAEEALIRKLATLSGEELDVDPAITPDQEQSVKRHINNYVGLYLQRPLKSLAFMHKMECAV
ncbi:MAG: DNA repair protein RecO [Endomicrobiales bacterium]|jgi:DNA repair protein RecO (recombination protein O)